VNQLPANSELEQVAAFLVLERPDLLEVSPEKQAAEVGVSLEVMQGLWRDPQFRTFVDQFLTWRVLDPGTRVRQLEKLKSISVDAERDADAIKAFDVLSRQARLKVPERHEVDDRKSVQVNVTHLPSEEGGFIPDTPFTPPEGRRARLGQKLERMEEAEAVRTIDGPFDSVDVEIISPSEENK